MRIARFPHCAAYLLAADFDTASVDLYPQSDLDRAVIGIQIEPNAPVSFLGANIIRFVSRSRSRDGLVLRGRFVILRPPVWGRIIARFGETVPTFLLEPGHGQLAPIT